MNALARAAPGMLAGNHSQDERLTRLALRLGERHLGLTWPNPSVGAVVVDQTDGDCRIVAQGITQPGGRPHAERVALESAGAAAKGATLYVSLEPCSHHGKTPPCTDAILASGVARVVTALEDPDPRVSGRGNSRLRQAGVTVVTGYLAEEARRAHRGHITRVKEGRPAIALKLARTADGFAGAPRRRAPDDHRRRRECPCSSDAGACRCGPRGDFHGACGRSAPDRSPCRASNTAPRLASSSTAACACR